MSAKKKILGIGLAVLIVALVGWMIMSSVNSMVKKKEIAVAIGEVPKFILLNTDSSSVPVNSGNTGNPLVIIYFNSGCDYCSEEAQAISDNIELFDEIELLFLSLEPLKDIRDFAKNKGLRNHDHVSFGQIDDATANDVLGITSAPQFFIYNAAGKLTKQFKGSTKIEALIKYANQM